MKRVQPESRSIASDGGGGGKGFFRNVLVVGLQRVGTNYCSALVEQNVAVDVIPSGNRSIAWKHAMPDEIGQNYSHTGLSVSQAVSERPDVAVVVITKNPYHWIESVRRYPADLTYQRKGMFDKSDRLLLKPAIEFYNEFHRQWLRLGRYLTGIEFVQYESLLAAPEERISMLASRFGLVRHSGFRPVERVYQTRQFTTERKLAYLNKDVNLPDHDVSQINSALDKLVMDTLGYASDIAYR